MLSVKGLEAKPYLAEIDQRYILFAASEQEPKATGYQSQRTMRFHIIDIHP